MIRNSLLLIALFSPSLLAQPNFPSLPEKAELIFQDIDNFISAYNQLNPASDTTEILKRKYFDKGTAGLKEYMVRHGLNPSMLASAISNHPETYRELVRGMPFLKKEYSELYSETLIEYKKEISDALFPPTYLIVGANRGIAQASRAGQLVTIEVNWDNPDRKMSTIIHELTHFQQAKTIGFSNYSTMYSKENNMLDIVLREGAAEFITYAIVRKNTESYTRLKYVENIETELWMKFKEDLKNQDKSYWLWESIDQDEVPILLGYTIGYKICESYYENATDKDQAIKDILGITEPEDFLNKSGYNP